MTTCQFAKFTNVSALQVSALMRIIASEHNTGETPMWLAYQESDGSFGTATRTGNGPPLAYRHISVSMIEPSTEVRGTFTVKVRVNGFLEPALGETREVAHEGWHWTNRADNAPVPVPRSLIYAMHDSLGIFYGENAPF